MFLFARVGIPHAGCQGHAYTKQMKSNNRSAPADHRTIGSRSGYRSCR